MGNKFIAVKQTIKERIIEDFGSIKDFHALHFEGKMSYQNLNYLVSPNSDIRISNLEKIIDVLGLRIEIKAKIKIIK